MAKVKGNTVVHATSGKVLSRHKSPAAAQKAAKATEARNVGSTKRSRKSAKSGHG